MAVTSDQNICRSSLHRIWSVLQTEWKENRVTWGALVCQFPLSVSGYFGNYLPYLHSYFKAKLKNDQMDPLWIFSILRVFFVVGLFTGGVMERKMGIVRSLYCAGFIKFASVVVCYWAIVNPYLLLLGYSIVSGLGAGIIITLSWKLIHFTAKNKRGRYGGFKGMCANITSAIIIGLTFLIVNPTNEKPTDVQKAVPLYTDEKIIDRVPYFFLMLGIVVLVCELVGCFLIKDYREEDMSDSEVIAINKDVKGITKENLTGQNGEFKKELSDVTETNIENNKSTDKNHGNGKINLKKSTVSEKSPLTTNSHDYSTKELYKLWVFWLFLIQGLLMQHTLYVQTNLYKQYGQDHISDDRLLTLIGILAMILSIISRLIMGVIVDRYGSKLGHVLIMFGAGFFIALMPLGFWLFPPIFVFLAPMATVCVLLCLDQITYLTFDLFGPKDFSSNLGITFIPQIIVTLLEPLFLPWVIGHYGQDYLFLTAAVSAALAQIITVSLPDRSRKFQSI